MSVWNDGWKCPNCKTEFVANGKPLEDGAWDWASPLHNPLVCGLCEGGHKCEPIGRNFKYTETYRYRIYDDGEITDDLPLHPMDEVQATSGTDSDRS